MCPISFNICGIKLNQGHFFFGTVITHFWDKPYQEINFKSHLNIVLLRTTTLNSALPCNKWKMLLDLHVPRIILISFLLTFAMKWKDANDENHWIILVFCDQWEIISSLNISQEKNAWYCFSSVVSVYFSHKTVLIKQ